MSWVALGLAILLALASAAAAALIVFPAPSQASALLAVWVGEQSFFIVGLAAVGAMAALFAARPGTRLVAAVAVVACLGAVVVALLPPAQALRLAGEQRVTLDFGRYFRARIDTMEFVSAKKTITYATIEGRALDLDVYAPTALPVVPSRAIVVAHGGGWSSGTKGEASYASQWLADRGFTVFDVEYRTQPRPIWKGSLGDLKCAVGWIKQHAATADWNIDPNKITLLGRSAGGHLALLAAYTAGDTTLPPSCEAGDTSVESVVAYYAPTDLAWGYAHPARRRVYDTSEKLRGFVGGPPESTGDLYRTLSPTARVTPSSPRTLLVHGGRDQLIAPQHVEFLTDKLQAAQVRFDTLIVPYAQHGFDFIFGGLSGQIAEAVLLRFLNTDSRPAVPTSALDPPPAAKRGAVVGAGGAGGSVSSEKTRAEAESKP